MNPHLPGEWDQAEVLNIPLPGSSASLYFAKKPSQLEVYLSPAQGDEWKLRSDLPGATSGPLDRELAKKLHIDPQRGLRIPIPALEVDLSLGDLNVIETVEPVLPIRPPLPGARTVKFRFLNAENEDRKLRLTIEGLAGSTGMVRLLRHGHFIPKVVTEPGTAPDASVSYRACDADLYACGSMPLIFSFPPGEGWKTITVTLTW
ncbi:MAG: hypothetical protein ABSE87_02085 [Terracidiphilus sp.]